VECVMIRVGQNRTRTSSGSKRSRRSFLKGGGAIVECVMVRVGQNRTRPSGSKRSRRSSPGKGGRGCKSGVRHD